MTGPLEKFLDQSTDLGPAGGHAVEITVALKESTCPNKLIKWGERHGLSVRWRPGDNWAYVEGQPNDFTDAFGVAIHDYRSRDGQVFYASKQDPEIPAAIRGEVTELGRILSYNPTHRA
jgi:kumamolisin